jgi:hypothetical protein
MEKAVLFLILTSLSNVCTLGMGAGYGSASENRKLDYPEETSRLFRHLVLL